MVVYSKITKDALFECVNYVIEKSKEKKRNFVETVELQVGLKNYDPQRDKRFSGTVKLRNIPCPRFKICVLGGQFLMVFSLNLSFHLIAAQPGFNVYFCFFLISSCRT